MALKAKSLFLYGISVNPSNNNIPFKASSGGPQLNGVVPVGTYSLSQFAMAIAAALNVADVANTYTVTVDRTIAGGTQNRITISTSGSFLSLLFSTGTTATSSIREIAGFGIFDFTGSTTYTNSASSGIPLTTAWYGKNYTDPTINQTNFGSVNIATDGTKEAITWVIQYFIDVEFMYEAQAQAFTNWRDLINWMIQQNPFEFTPEITSPSVFYPVTLEKSSADGKGLGFMMKEQLPQFPFLYTTGPMKLRVIGAIS